MKRCRGCGQTKPIDQFASDRTKPDGHMARCSSCSNAARMRRYYADLDRERERSRGYYAGHREQHMASATAWRAANPEKGRGYGRAQLDTRRGNPQHLEQERIRYMKRHGGTEEWARLFEAQNGRCYLCGHPLPADQRHIHVDHDHDCCPGGRRTESCAYCRRGLACSWCNQIIGLAGENMELLRAIIANFEPVQAETRERIAAKPQQDMLALADRGSDLAPSRNSTLGN